MARLSSLSRRELRGGSLLTVELAGRYNKPVIHLCAQDEGTNHAQELRAFIEEFGISVLNVAGPRESDEPGFTGSYRAFSIRRAAMRRKG